MSDDLKMYMVFSPRHALTIQATSPREAMETARASGLLDPTKDTPMVAEAAFVDRVLTVTGEPFIFYPKSMEEGRKP